MVRLLFILFLSFTCLAMNPCLAQEAYRYRAVLSVPSGASIKGLHEHLGTLVRTGKWEFTEATGTLELKLYTVLSGEGLQAHLADLGVTVSSFESLAASNADLATPRRRFPAHPDFPVFLDTGDPILDGQRYEQEKSTWIATHPEAYLEMSAPVPVTYTQQPE